METKGYVYLIEDDLSVQKSLIRALSKQGLEVISYTTAAAFLAAAPKHTPEMILLDMQMPGITGLQLQEKMNKQSRLTPIIFISGQSHPQQIIESLKKGAVDFFLKPFNLADLIKAIFRALELDHGLARRLKLHQSIADRFSTLTEREKEVFELLTLGLMNIKIGEILGIAPATVKIFKANVMRKMQADSEQDLVLLKVELKREFRASWVRA